MKIFEILLTLASGTYGIIVALNWRQSNWWKRSAAILAIILAFVVGWNAYNDYSEAQILKRIESKIGELNALKGHPKPHFQVRGTGVIMILDGETSLFGSSVSNANMLGAEIENGMTYVYAVIRDREGKVIAAIDKNVWELVDEDYDYNDDEKALEIVTKGDRQLVFQIELSDGLVMYAGRLCDESGLCVQIGALPGDTRGRSYMRVVESNEMLVPTDIAYKLIFKYPRKKFYGVRA